MALMNSDFACLPVLGRLLLVGFFVHVRKKTGPFYFSDVSVLAADN